MKWCEILLRMRKGLNVPEPPPLVSSMQTTRVSQLPTPIVPPTTEAARRRSSQTIPAQSDIQSLVKEYAEAKPPKQFGMYRLGTGEQTAVTMPIRRRKK